jgi:hypothetical protein
MEITHHVTVRRKRGLEFVAEFEDMPGKPSIPFDEPAPLGENHAPNAAAVLGARGWPLKRHSQRAIFHCRVSAWGTPSRYLPRRVRQTGAEYTDAACQARAFWSLTTNN